MRAFLTVSWIEAKLFLRNFYSPFFSLAFPLMMLLLFGSIYGNAPDAFFGGHGAMDVSVPSYMGIALGVNGLMTLPLTLSDYRQKKILKRFRATPANPALLLLSQLFVSLVMTLAGVAALGSGSLSAGSSEGTAATSAACRFFGKPVRSGSPWPSGSSACSRSGFS